jgi:hypothetical protein
MNDIEAVEKVIAGLTDKRDRAVARLAEIAAERQRIAFAAHATGDAVARTRLDKLRVDAVFITGELEDIDGALAEANERLAAARDVADHAAGEARVGRVHQLLAELEECAPELDKGVGRTPPDEGAGRSAMPTADPFRYLSNPSLQVRTAKLIGELLAELRVMGLGRYQLEQFDLGEGGKKMLTVDISLPNWNWALASRTSLRTELMTLVSRYQHGHFAPHQRDSFTSLILGWATHIRRDLAARFADNERTAA